MKPVKLRKLSFYLRVLESATFFFVTNSTMAAALPKDKDITLVLTHPGNWTVEGRIESVSHEVVHMAHKLSKLDDVKQNDEQEKEIDRLSKLLCNRAEWCISVLFWLERAMEQTIREEVPQYVEEAGEHNDSGKN